MFINLVLGWMWFSGVFGLCFGGGGSSAPDNSGQNAAALQNAEISKQMWEEYQKTYLPKEQQFAEEAFNYDTPGRREQDAGLAGAAVQQSLSNERGIMERSLSRAGVAPGSGKSLALQNDAAIQGAALEAGAQNASRMNTEKMGWARKQDAISIGKGMPGTAVSATTAAGNAYGQIADNQAKQNATESQDTSNTVRGGMDAYKLYKGLKDGGLVKGYAMGGRVVGNPRMKQLMDNQGEFRSGPRGENKQVGLGDVRQAYDLAKLVGTEEATGTGLTAPAGAADMMGTGAVEGAGTSTSVGSGLHAGSSVSGLTAPAGATLGSGTGAAATTAAEIAASEAAAAGTTAAAGTSAATTAAAGAGASSAATGLAAIGPVGWIAGAALLASQLLKNGGKVKGKGGPRDDAVPIMASNGEFVVNAAAVKKFGVKNLEKINNMGLSSAQRRQA